MCGVQGRDEECAVIVISATNTAISRTRKGSRTTGRKLSIGVTQITIVRKIDIRILGQKI